MGNIDIRQPNINGNDHEMLLALRSYLYQLCEQLQYAFDMLESGQGGAKGTTTVIQQMGGGVVSPSANANPELTFNSIKDMIIKSGEIARAYYKKIDDWLIEDKHFVAQSVFGEYEETVKTKLGVVDGAIALNTEQVQTISEVFQPNAKEGEETLDTCAKIVKNSGYIKAGLVGTDEYGIEIGLRRETNARQETRMSRFTSNRVVIYDQNGDEGVELNDQSLIAKRVYIDTNLYEGKFVDEIDTNGNITTRWVGAEDK